MKFTFFLESPTPTSGGADGEMIDNSAASMYESGILR